MAQGPYKGRADYLELGDYNAVCSLCNRKRKASTLEKNWMGLYRCPEHNEPRQPQDFVRNVPDIMTVPWGQPQEVYLVGSAGYCDINSSSAIPGYAEPGCMIPDVTFLIPYYPIPEENFTPPPPIG
jgi:hypothetical protein